MFTPSVHVTSCLACCGRVALLFSITIWRADSMYFDPYFFWIVTVINQRLQETRWMWPLAAAVSVAVMSNSFARRRLPQLARRVLLGLIVFVGLCGLVAAVAVLRRPEDLLIPVLVVIVGLLLAAWSWFFRAGSPRPCPPRRWTASKNATDWN